MLETTTESYHVFRFFFLSLSLSYTHARAWAEVSVNLNLYDEEDMPTHKTVPTEFQSRK